MRVGVIWGNGQFEQAYERNRPEIPGQPARGHGRSPEGPISGPCRAGRQARTGTPYGDPGKPLHGDPGGANVPDNGFLAQILTICRPTAGC